MQKVEQHGLRMQHHLMPQDSSEKKSKLKSSVFSHNISFNRKGLRKKNYIYTKPKTKTNLIRRKATHHHKEKIEMK